MAKHAKKSDHLQIVESPKALIEVPLPLLGALASTRNAFFELCVDAGRQVLSAMMEQDREWLCGPLWKRDPERVCRPRRIDTERGDIGRSAHPSGSTSCAKQRGP